MRAKNGSCPERILVFGHAGSGKSTAALSIAKACQPARIHVLDTDAAYRRMVGRNSENVIVTEAREWTEIKEFTTTTLGTASPDDWVVFDFVGAAWSSVQSYYTEQVFGLDSVDFFLRARIAAKNQDDQQSHGGLDGWRDWGVVNRLYDRWSSQLKLFERRGVHVLATAAADSTKNMGDTAASAAFGPFGVKPRGQKHLAHLFHSVLLFKMSAVGRWTMTSVKDRGREPFQETPIVDFATQYLLGRAEFETS